MKLSLNLFTHKLTIALQRKRRLLTLKECAKETGLKFTTIRNYPYFGKVKTRGIVNIRGKKAGLYDIEEIIAVAERDNRRKQR